MSKSVECRSCGNVYPANKDKCGYCGTVNDSPKSDSSNEQENGSVRFYNGPIDKTPKGEVNLIVLIILIIVFWPAAIIYYLYCEKNKS